jgi:hypothetical protein
VLVLSLLLVQPLALVRPFRLVALAEVLGFRQRAPARLVQLQGPGRWVLQVWGLRLRRVLPLWRVPLQALVLKELRLRLPGPLASAPFQPVLILVRVSPRLAGLQVPQAVSVQRQQVLPQGPVAQSNLR